MKMIGIILLSVSSAVAAESTPFVPKDPWHRDTTLNRRISIRPKSPDEGIDSGLVIFMGHLIPPPYKVEWQDERLLINGVKVEPSIQWEQSNDRLQNALKSRTDEQRRQSEAMHRAVTAIQDLARNGASHSEIIAFAKSQPGITSVEMRDGLLWVNEGDGKFFIMLAHKGQPKITFTKEEIAAKNRAARENKVRKIEGRLMRGRILLFTATGAHGERLNSLSFPSCIPEIMENPALSQDEKYEAIKNLNRGGERDLAWEVILNYDAKEWAIAKSPRFMNTRFKTPNEIRDRCRTPAR